MKMPGSGKFYIIVEYFIIIIITGIGAKKGFSFSPTWRSRGPGSVIYGKIGLCWI